ncbi:MAG: nucleotidyltransferase family protein [Gemmatimonadaceae bacterium]
MLLRSVVGDATPKSISEIATLASAPIDWEQLYRLASRHAVIPLLDQHLGRTLVGAMPANFREKLRSAAELWAVRSLFLSAQLVSIVRDLERANIDALPFKGPALAALVYGNLALRQYQDLDILVHRTDLEGARAALLVLGFKPAVPYSESQRSSIELTGHHELLLDEAGTTVELHWSLNHRTLTQDFFESRWWEDRQTIAIGGESVRTLGPERLILYLCMHGGKHSWARLSWVADLQRALRAFPGVDWQLVTDLALDNGALRMVAVGIALTNSLFDADTATTPAIDHLVHHRSTQEIVAQLSSRFLRVEEHDEVQDLRVQLQLRDRWRDRARYTWHILARPHPADIALLHLPRQLHGAYYLLRPIRLIFRRLLGRTNPRSAA